MKTLTQASCGGHGTFEIRHVTQVLDTSRIPCCIVGVSALIFYGVPRVRDKWDICVPTERMKDAIALLKRCDEFIQTNEKQAPQPMSLAHTYTWFQGTTVNFRFCLVPSTHARIAVGKIVVRRSPNGVPYAPLEELVQSCLDMNDQVSLCDIIDGLNLPYEWGQKHLNLEGTTDVEWAHQRNIELMGGEGKFNPLLLGSAYPTARVKKASLWFKTTKEKRQRLARMMVPQDLFETRYLMKGSTSEPWMIQRDSC